MSVFDERTAKSSFDLLCSASKDVRLTRGDLATYTFILDRVGCSDGEYISAGEMAQGCGVSVRLVRYATTTLERLGYVSVESSPGKENRYSIMNSQRAQQIEDGLSGIARKVLDAVPKTDAWAAAAILGEIKRATGSSYEMKLINGCLESLKHSGLVREPKQGQWIRAPVKEAHVLDAKKILAPAEKVADEQKPAGSMDRLADVANQLRILAHVVEEIACDIEQGMQHANEKTAKLRQLQELLRGLGQ